MTYFPIVFGLRLPKSDRCVPTYNNIATRRRTIRSKFSDAELLFRNVQ